MGRHSSIGINTYRHLNKDDTIPFDIEATARHVVSLNYGLHRFLSAAVTECEIQRGSDDEMAVKLRELLAAGYF